MHRLMAVMSFYLLLAGNVSYEVVDWTRSSALVHKATKFWTVEITQVVCLVVGGKPEWMQLTSWNGVL